MLLYATVFTVKRKEKYPMKKKILAVVSLVLVFSFLFAFAGCSGTNTEDETTTTTTVQPTTQATTTIRQPLLAKSSKSLPIATPA